LSVHSERKPPWRSTKQGILVGNEALPALDLLSFFSSRRQTVTT
jgi:hypothetical protein